MAVASHTAVTKTLEWTDDEKLNAIIMFNKGISLSEIGKEFNRSRSAVAGMLHRSRGRNDGLVEKPPRKTKPKGCKRHAWKGPRPVVVPQNVLPATQPHATETAHRTRLRLIDSAAMVTLVELKPHHCRWPFGDPRNSDFRFCGCNKADEKGPYCAEHTRAASRRTEWAAMPPPEGSNKVRPHYRVTRY